jgi:hypothetical protein
MSLELQKFYPGDDASAKQVLLLADEYRRAAITLRMLGRPRNPMSRAPCRLLAIHAIELYLNAVLLAFGWKAARLRGFQHDLVSRTHFAKSAGLVLRKRTEAHIGELSANREYLLMRYGTELPLTACQLSGLEATLREIAEKAGKLVGRTGP